MDLIRIIIFCWFCWLTVIKGCTKEYPTSSITERSKEQEPKNSSTVIYQSHQKLFEMFQQEKENRRKAEENQRKAEEDRRKAEEDRRKAKEDRRKAEEDRRKAEEDRRKAEEDRCRVEKKLYVLECAKNHRYAIRYFKIFMDRAYIMSQKKEPNVSSPLPNFQAITKTKREESFRKYHETINPEVKVQNRQIKKYSELNDAENKTYYDGYIRKSLTQTEAFLIGLEWLRVSDEYKTVCTDPLETERLESFVNTYREAVRNSSGSKKPLTPEILHECIMSRWDEFSKVIKVDPSYNIEDLYERLFKMSRASHNLARYCSFLLNDILHRYPIRKSEKTMMKAWISEGKIKIDETYSEESASSLSE